MIDISNLTTSGAWRLEALDDGIAALIFDLPGEKVNKLTAAVLEDLDRVLAEIDRDGKVKALIVEGGKPDSGTFIAGADIHEIRSIDHPEVAREKASLGQSVLHRLHTMSAVTVAAVHGACVGGGTELALACDLRVASHSPKTRISLPEVQLGILPGFGGSQRLPRLIGLANALPVVLRGEKLAVKKALKLGVVDRVVYPDLVRGEALALARAALANGGKAYRPRRPKRPLVLRLLERLSIGRALIARTARKGIAKSVGEHYPAPYRALDAMTRGLGMSLEKGLELEARLVGELIASPITKNLIDLFLTSEEARRGRPDAEGRRPESCVAEGGRVGVLGAGVMGGGLAAWLTRQGFRVRMKDIHGEAIAAGFRKIDEIFRARVKRRRMTRFERDGCLGRVTATTDYRGFGRVPLVIEAVVENLEIKKKVLAEVEAKLPPDAIFASNTSALSITALASASERPERVVGLHFFNPVERMPLVEVIRGEKTSDEVVAQVEAFARAIGKVPVRCNDGPGFLVNRVLGPYLNEAVRLFEEGFSPEAVDATVRKFGMPMGPFELLDEVGLDVAGKVGSILHDAFGERARPPVFLESLRDRKDTLGKKTGKGFYLHSGKKRKPNRELIVLGGSKGGAFKPDDPELWIKRLVYPMVNEAARALDEGIVARPSEVDLAMVFGTGFAPFRGGPLRFADVVGLDRIREGLESLREPRLVACDLVLRLAQSSQGFYETLENSSGEHASRVESAEA